MAADEATRDEKEVKVEVEVRRRKRRRREKGSVNGGRKRVARVWGSGAVQEALIHPGVMPWTVKEDIQRRCIFAASRS